MNLIRILPALFILVSAYGALPRCEWNGEFEQCERDDQNCSTFVAEHSKSDENGPWKEHWGGCWRPALILKGHVMAGRNYLATGHVTIVPSYVDSERMDLMIKVELSNGETRRIDFDNQPIILHGNIPYASVDFYLEPGLQIVGVPTIQTVEKGGKRQMAHHYK